jgi:hypothetical protein
MDSPLRMLHNHVGATILSAISNVFTNEHQFELHFPFPVGQGFSFADRVMLRTTVIWDPSQEGVFLETSLRSLDSNLWKDPDLFFMELGNEVRLFLCSAYASDPSRIPDGGFYQVPDKKEEIKVVPIFGSCIPYEDEEDRAWLCEMFGTHIQCAGNTLWLANAVLSEVERQGKAIGAEERMRLLMLAHGKMLVVRPEGERQQDSPPPEMFFPEGLYGGNIHRLPPQ